MEIAGSWQKSAKAVVPNALFVVAASCLALAIFMPEIWFRPAFVDPALAAPRFPGILLLRACLILDAVALLFLGRWLLSEQSQTAADKIQTQPLLLSVDGDISRTLSTVIFAFITLLGVALRFIGLGDGLWIDEISPVADLGSLSTLQVISTYLGSNNHILNTILVNESISFFGMHEWAIRLPAAIFGILSVPAIYWLARFALSRRASLCAAALLATSYHHVFFSQNARGYSAYLLFSILGTGLFIAAMRTGKSFWWAIYIIVGLLNIAALLNAVFMIVAQGAIALVVALLEWKSTRSFGQVRRTLFVYSAIGVLSLQLYSIVLPQVLGVISTTYKMKAAGFDSPFSAEFLADLIGGLAPAIAIGSIAIGLSLAALAAVGFSSLAKAQWLLPAALLLPNIVLLIFVTIGQLSVTPRLFIFGLVLMILSIAAGLEKSIDLIMLRWTSKTVTKHSFAGVAALAISASLASLMGYYRLPKQDYAGAVQYVNEARRPGDVVIVVYLAKYGYRFYSEQLRYPIDRNTYFVRNVDQFNSIVNAAPGRHIWIVSTFERALRLDYPEIDRMIKDHWIVTRRFPGKIADGNVLVYRPTNKVLTAP